MNVCCPPLVVFTVYLSIWLCLPVYFCFCQFYWLKKKIKNRSNEYPRLITVTTSTKVANSFLQGHGPFWIAYVHAVVTPFPFQSNYGHTSASASAFDCCCCYGIPGGSQVSVVATSFHVISNGIFWCETSCSSLTLDLCSFAEDFNFFWSDKVVQSNPKLSPTVLSDTPEEIDVHSCSRALKFSLFSELTPAVALGSWFCWLCGGGKGLTVLIGKRNRFLSCMLSSFPYLIWEASWAHIREK